MGYQGGIQGIYTTQGIPGGTYWAYTTLGIPPGVYWAIPPWVYQQVYTGLYHRVYHRCTIGCTTGCISAPTNLRRNLCAKRGPFPLGEKEKPLRKEVPVPLRKDGETSAQRGLPAS